MTNVLALIGFVVLLFVHTVCSGAHGAAQTDLSRGLKVEGAVYYLWWFMAGTGLATTGYVWFLLWRLS